jgi:excisionase family DNA binding protein
MDKNIQNNSEKLPSRLLTGKDVAHLLKISSSQAYKIMRRGELPAVHIGRSIRVKPEDLETYIAQNTTSYGGFQW